MKAKKYLLFFLLGYCIYIAIEVTYRGYSFRLMGIAGGLSLAGIGMLEDAGLRRFPLAFQMMVSAVLITAIELYSGMFSLRVLHYRMWDYSALPFSFCDGRDQNRRYHHLKRQRKAAQPGVFQYLCLFSWATVFILPSKSLTAVTASA